MKPISIIVLALLSLAACLASSSAAAMPVEDGHPLVDPHLRLQPEARRLNISVSMPLNQKFFLGPEPLTWYEANYYCGMGNMKLIQLNTPSVEAELKGFLTYYGLESKFYWTGGNRFNAQKTWVWGLYGSIYSNSYKHWALNAPSNNTDSENCLAIWGQSNLWYTLSCDVEYDFICQK
ncbi:unnamed protein product [Ceratitis capitata]|uniref:(Mediterranean fruit fly) hypothetical protein n=1 Tax=Ceratitis capitata TaxID=7213 RepID=A0A811UMX7_CERCA|nr:unnamed protein product [Ceratitis capitata]